ncbi:14056_t:CDS:2 [Cetraspora pellucida]|uniref:14056_t:CDS:1 n=1 Tax=Cetraspora pellucida TaxID=1433469 RepID=A0A9N9NDV9_9GLOM|nr:14056_t:CDS:2 [Cetraspora pellucida]
MSIENSENQNIINEKVAISASIKTHKLTEKSSLGLTEEDNVKNINTIDAKLEELCLYYSRLNVIYDKRQNVQPAFLENFKLNNKDESNNQDKTERENNIQN